MTKKLTPWFPGKVKPVRRGYYECKRPESPVRDSQLDYWDGKAWRWFRECSPYLPKYQNIMQWRGLAQPTK